MLIDLATAKLNLRVDGNDEDALIADKLEAAESSAAQFLNRRIFADQGALDAAVAGVPAALIAAGVTYSAALAAADTTTDDVAAYIAREYAGTTYAMAQTAARETYSGIVLNKQIQEGILLILCHLYENRQDVQTGATSVQIPMGSEYRLQPFRVALGL